MSYKKKVLNFTLFSGLSTYLESFVGLVLSVLIARQLGAEDFGRYSVLLMIASIGVALANGGTKTTVIKFMAEARGKGECGVARSALRHVLKVQLLFIPATLVFLFAGVSVYFSATGELVERFLAGLVVLAIAPKALQLFYVSVAKGMESFKNIFLINALVTPINFLMVVVIVIAGGGLEAFVIAYVVISCVYFLASWYWVQRDIRREQCAPAAMPQEFRQRLNRFLLLSTLNHVLIFVVGREIEILFLSGFGYVAEAGFYKVAFTLAETAITLVPGIFGSVLLPVMAKSLGQSADVQARRFRESGRFMMILAAPIVIFGVVFARPLIGFLYSAEYSPSVSALQILLLFFGFTMLNQLCASVLLSHDRQGTVMKVVLVTATMNVVLDYLLIRHYALPGAVAATVITKLSHAVIYQLLVSRILDTRLDYGDYVHTYFLALIAALPVWVIYEMIPRVYVLIPGALVFFALYIVLLLISFKVTRLELEIIRSALSRYVWMNRFFQSRFYAWLDQRYLRHERALG